MSAYLSFYIVPNRKTTSEEKNYVFLTAFAKKSVVYKVFTEETDILSSEGKYHPINIEDIQKALDMVSHMIKRSRDRKRLYEKCAVNNTDYIKDALDIKQYIEELEDAKSKIDFLYNMLYYANFYGDQAMEELCCTTD